MCLCDCWGQGAVICRTGAGCVPDGAEEENEGGVTRFLGGSLCLEHVVGSSFSGDELPCLEVGITFR